jgi:hypothetical protein
LAYGENSTLFRRLRSVIRSSSGGQYNLGQISEMLDFRCRLPDTRQRFWLLAGPGLREELLRVLLIVELQSEIKPHRIPRLTASDLLQNCAHQPFGQGAVAYGCHGPLQIIWQQSADSGPARRNLDWLQNKPSRRIKYAGGNEESKQQQRQ